MSEYLLFRYLHFLSLFIMVGCVISQQFLISKNFDSHRIRRMVLSDTIYGISAIVVALIGLTLWFWVGKPGEFYNRNWLFHLKIGLFILVGVLSIFPTLFYLKSRKRIKKGEAVTTPGYIIIIVRLELILLLFIPVLSVLMATGIGRI
ncbi:DUF2214 family protein [Robertkochia aurantiaca]|uniref:DUF2214 family protein n=1 Tax=Robertkochia aurantiaca TaxID=2873700 RepID=UPI001CCE1122|nr:DUF2214 family protein [Robertkochia sp. 3YJGBD-33]